MAKDPSTRYLTPASTERSSQFWEAARHSGSYYAGAELMQMYYELAKAVYETDWDAAVA